MEREGNLPIIVTQARGLFQIIGLCIYHRRLIYVLLVKLYVFFGYHWYCTYCTRYTCVPGTVPYLGTRYSFYGQKIIGCTLLLNISVVYMCSNEFIQITKITMAGPTIQRGKKKKTQNRKITSSTVCSLLSIPG